MRISYPTQTKIIYLQKFIIIYINYIIYIQYIYTVSTKKTTDYLTITLPSSELQWTYFIHFMFTIKRHNNEKNMYLTAF